MEWPMAEKKKKPKIKVLDWPAIPVPTAEEVYGLTTEEKEKIEKNFRISKNGEYRKENLHR